MGGGEHPSPPPTITKAKVVATVYLKFMSISIIVDEVNYKYKIEL